MKFIFGIVFALFGSVSMADTLFGSATYKCHTTNYQPGAYFQFSTASDQDGNSQLTDLRSFGEAANTGEIYFLTYYIDRKISLSNGLSISGKSRYENEFLSVSVKRSVLPSKVKWEVFDGNAQLTKEDGSVLDFDLTCVWVGVKPRW